MPHFIAAAAEEEKRGRAFFDGSAYAAPFKQGM
jgi:hypothetical protein